MSHSVPDILLIDDSVEVIQIVSRILQSTGEIRFALTGQEGIQLALEQVPDLILLDIELGDMSGFEVLDQIKKHEILQHTPVLFASVHTDPMMEIAALKAGASGMIYKPFDASLLRTRVVQALKKDLPQETKAAVEHVCKILLIEIDLANIVKLLGVLENKSNDLIITSSSMVTADMIKTGHFNLVLIGGSCQLETVQQLCSMITENDSVVPLVFVGSKPPDSNKVALLEAGVDDVIDINDSYRLIRARLQKQLELTGYPYQYF